MTCLNNFNLCIDWDYGIICTFFNRNFHHPYICNLPCKNLPYQNELPDYENNSDITLTYCFVTTERKCNKIAI